MPSRPDLHRAFLRLNRRWFQNELPSTIQCKWFRSIEDDMGDYGHDMIRVNIKLAGWRCAWELVLLHEMCHCAVEKLRGGEQSNHGTKWKHERRRLYAAGAFEKYI